MTISSTTRKAGPFTGTGAQTVFPFTFKVFSASDLLAVQAVTATGVESTKLLTTDYTVALNADQNASPGGNLTMIVAPPVGTTLTLSSQVPNLQGTDLTNQGGFYPKVVNDALDRATIQIQQLAEKLGRALTFGISSGASGSLPNPVALALLGWNAAGTALQNYAGVATTAVSSFMAPVVASINGAAARAALGATAVGEALYTAANAAAARTTIGAQVAGNYASQGADNTITSLTALTAGGLPDNSVLTADIADAQITPAKLNGAQSGSAPIFGARAWVNFNGTGTVAIRASGNVSSITDNGTGDYTVNFTTAMQDANYAAIGTSGGTTNAFDIRTYDDVGARTTSGCRFILNVDAAQVNLVFFR